jgi:hypothetical protein
LKDVLKAARVKAGVVGVSGHSTKAMPEVTRSALLVISARKRVQEVLGDLYDSLLGRESMYSVQKGKKCLAR